jgi:hypothetical protein
MKKIFVATILIISLFGLSALAQTSHHQTASSKNDNNRFGTPISGVQVTLEQESGTVLHTIRTDAKGQFEFNQVLPGRYRLKVDHSVLSPRDSATGQASGKRTPPAGSTSAVVAPRDTATGQATGKRQHARLAENNNENTETSRTGINTSRSNIKNQRVAAEIVSDDEADPVTSTKGDVSSSRSNSNSQGSEGTVMTAEEVITVQLFPDEAPIAKRTLIVPHVLEKTGLLVQVGADGRLIGNVLKTKHDTVKNSINNVR